MGMLDQILGGATARAGARHQGPGSTIMAGVVLALVVKAARQYMNQAPAGQGAAAGGAAPVPTAPVPTAPGQGGLGGMLNGALGGILGGSGGGAGSGGLGGLGGILGGLGGSGALGALINQLQQKGLGPQVNSWVGSGANQTVAPHQLADALGEDAVQALQQETGLPRDAMLNELSAALPEAVHESTPHGRLPTDEELHHIAGGAPQAAR